LIIEPRLGGLGYKETEPLPKVLAEKKLQTRSVYYFIHSFRHLREFV